EALADPGQAKTVRFTGGAPVPTDGPFAEVKESLAGFWIVDVDEERAIQIVSQVVGYTEYPMEVRRIMDHSAQPWPVRKAPRGDQSAPDRGRAARVHAAGPRRSGPPVRAV